MPLNSLPPTTTAANLRTKQDVAAAKAHIDVGFWGGALPDNVKDLRPLHDAGVFGFKCFLSPSGVDEFPHLNGDQLTASMAEIAGFGGLLIVHAEDPHELDVAPHNSGPKYDDYLATRPRISEDVAIKGLIDTAKRIGARVHILHLSSSDALPLIAEAKEGVSSSASRRARTTSRSPPRKSRTARASSSAARPSARPPTRTCCGRRSPTAPSTASSPTTRRRPPT